MLEADAFKQFEREGLFSRETGQAFRETILSVGNSVPPMDAFQQFVGRAPTQDAMLSRLGLLER